MPPHRLANFELQNCYQNEPKFNGVFSRNNLPKTKNWGNVINLEEFKSIETNWIALQVNGDNVMFSDSFGVKHIQKQIKKTTGNKNVITYIFIEFKQMI